MLKNVVIKTVGLSTAAALFLIGAAAVFSNHSAGYNRLLIPEFLLLVFLYLGFVYLSAFTPYVSSKSFLFLASGFTFLIRLLWISSVHTLPVSDFKAYHYYAYYASQGFFTAYDTTYTVFPFKIGYPLILSVFYRLFGVRLYTAQVLNVVASVVALLLIYFTGNRIYGEKSGRTASLLYMAWPAQIMYCSVVASEHVFMVFFLLSIYLLVALKNIFISRKACTLAFCTGISLALAQFVRPISLMVLPVAAPYLLLFHQPQESRSGPPQYRLLQVGILFGGYLLTLHALNLWTLHHTDINITHSSPGYSLFVGSNYETTGRTNDEDEKILKEFQYDSAKIHSEAVNRAIARISADPAGFFKLAARKFPVQWGDEDYGYTFAMSDSVETPFTPFIKSHSAGFVKISRLYYLLVLLFSFFGCLRAVSNQTCSPLVLHWMILGFAVSYCFFEVQGRYHMPALPFLLIFAGYGTVQILEGSSIRPFHKGFDTGVSPAASPPYAITVVLILALSVSAGYMSILSGRSASGIINGKVIYGDRVVTFKTPVPSFRNSTFISLADAEKIFHAITDIDAEKGTVRLQCREKAVLLKVASDTALVKGTLVRLPAPVKTVKGITYVPLRFIAECFECKVEFDPMGNITRIIPRHGVLPGSSPDTRHPGT